MMAFGVTYFCQTIGIYRSGGKVTLLTRLFLAATIMFSSIASIAEIYHVVLDVHPTHASTSQKNVLLDDTEYQVQRLGGHIIHRFEHAFVGLAISIDEEQSAALQNLSGVKFIEPEKFVYLVAENNWGLDRIDQETLPLSNSYSPTATGVGSHIFIVDTGLNVTHTDFQGRLGTHFSAVNDNQGITDCNGHGTHVAGTAAGTDHGVAKSATIHAVKVFPCNGSFASTTDIIEGIEWIITQQQPHSVVNMSLGAIGQDQAMEAAVANGVDQGVAFALAAGNNNANSCNFTPAREPKAVTVGASDINDNKASFSNFGSCTDLYAPGVDILSASNLDATGTRTLSGTSMAAPHVAGGLAIVWQIYPNATAAQLTPLLTGATAKDQLKGVRIDQGDPNMLLNVKNIDPNVCVRRAPKISITPTERLVTVNSYYAMLVTIENRDSNGCGSTGFTVAPTGPGIQAQPSSTVLNTAPSTSRTNSFNIRAIANGVQSFNIGVTSANHNVSQTAIWRATASPYLSGLNYRYAEGDFVSIPDFSAIRLDKAGPVNGIDLTVRARSNDIALSYSGYLNIASSGTYEFNLSSSGIAGLVVNGNRILTTTTPGATGLVTIALRPGHNLFEVQFVHDQGVPNLNLQWRAPGGALESIPVALFQRLPVPNYLPEVELGPTQEFRPPFNHSGTLVATARDIDGTITNYAWQKISGPNATLGGTSTSTLTLSNLNVGTYVFSCTVNDNAGAQTTDTVTVEVAADLPPLTQGVAYRYFEGTWPSVPDFSQLTPVKSGANADFSLAPRLRNENFGMVFTTYLYSDVNERVAIFMHTDDGSRLYVNDTLYTTNEPPASYYVGIIKSMSRGYNKIEIHYQQKTDNFFFNVKTTDAGNSLIDFPANRLFYVAPANLPPQVNAGSDRQVQLPLASLLIPGTAFDTDGTIASVQWQKTQGPTVTMSGAQTLNLTLSNLKAGAYTFELRATDNLGASSTDTVNVNVLSAPPRPNEIPVVDAGDDITLAFPQNETTLEGWAHDYDGDIVFTSWQLISAPTPTQFPASLMKRSRLDLRDLNVGTYEFEFRATDDEGAFASDRVKVIVSP